MSAHTTIAVDEASQLDAQIEALEGVLQRLRAMRDAREMPVASESVTLLDNRPDAFRDDDLIELHVAAKRFDILDDKLRRWCRTHKIGEKFGGRWLISISKLRKHIDR